MKVLPMNNDSFENRTSKVVNKASYADLFDRIQDPILLLDPETYNLVDFNPITQIFYGFNDYHETYNLNIFELIDPKDLDVFLKHLGTLARRYNNKQFKTKFYIPNLMCWKYVDIMMGSLDIGNNKKIIQLIIKDITESIQLHQQLEALSITDGLTELYNKRYFEKKMYDEIERSFRNKKPFSLIMMDIDNFKNYNDTNGHPAGDKLLKEFAHEIKQRIRGTDIACRYGGEEFAIICSSTGVEEAVKIAERIKHYITTKPFDNYKKQPLGFVSASIGIGTISDAELTEWENCTTMDKKDYIYSCINKIKELSDKNLYQAKKNGRNQVIF